MTPDPAPYGADLPRPTTPGDEPCVLCNDSSRRCDICPDAEWRRLILHGYVPALDAANAEVLALRAERDALRELLDYVNHDSWRCYSKGYYPDECCCGLDGYLIAAGVDVARYHVAVQYPTDEAIASSRAPLPAPTRPIGCRAASLGIRAEDAVVPGTSPQAPGGSGANTGEAGHG